MGINDLSKQFGIELPEAPVVKSEGGFVQHKYPVGDYSAIIGEFKTYYKDAEGKKCDEDTPGAYPAFGMLFLYILADPDGVVANISNGEVTVPDDIEYNRMLYKQFIPFDPKKQFSNIWLFGDLVYNDYPDSAVIQGEMGAETVMLKNLGFYKGAYVTFELTTNGKTETRFIKKQTLLLGDHAIDKEKIAKRKQIFQVLSSIAEAKLEALKAKQSSKNDSPTAAPVEVSDPDDFLSQYGD